MNLNFNVLEFSVYPFIFIKMCPNVQTGCIYLTFFKLQVDTLVKYLDTWTLGHFFGFGHFVDTFFYHKCPIYLIDIKCFKYHLDTWTFIFQPFPR